MRNASDPLLLIALLLCTAVPAQAQRIFGSFEKGVPRPDHIVLQETWGGAHRTIDSVAVDRKGRFSFINATQGPGFHRLVAGPDDVVDLVIDPREQDVVLRFTGRPMQEHVTVLRSAQNQALWEYKRASREGQARLAALAEERKGISPRDKEGFDALALREADVRSWQQAILDRLVASDPKGTFQRVVATDKRLAEAATEGSPAIAKAMPWADPAMVRSSLYPKAVMAYLQKLPDPQVQDFIAASDSLLAWSAEDTLCWSFSRSFLLRLFSVYGPDEVALHLVERYVTGPGALRAPDAEVLAASAQVLRTAPGSVAPDVGLVDPVKSDTLSLYSAISGHRYSLLFFYSSTCDHCHEQMPGLVEVYRDLHGKGLQILGIALDADLEEFRSTLEQRGLPWPAYSELNGWGSAAAKAFGVRSTPAFFLLDASGTIVAKPYDHQELRTTLVGLL